MTNDADQASPTLDQVRAGVLAQMTGPGAPFELTTETVRGYDAKVFVNRPRSVRDLARGAVRHGDSEFLVLEDLRLTFNEFAARVEQMISALAGLGVGHGDRVAIFAANRPEWVVTFFAIASRGAVAVAMNGWWTTAEAHDAIGDTTPSIIFGDSRRLERLDTTERDGAAHVGESRIVDFDSDTFAALWNHQPDSDAAPADEPDIAEDDPALILFTSGTTGRAKGALVTHRGMAGFAQSMILGASLRAVVEMTLAGQAPPSDPPAPGVNLGSTPLFHVSGLFGHVLMSLATGAKIVYFHGRFEAEKILTLIEKERINAFSPMGATGSRLINHPRFAEFDTSSVERIGLGGAPTSPAMQEALLAAFPSADAGLGGGYGSSESTAVVTSQGSAEFAAGPERAGRPHPDVELEIRDDDGNPVATGVEGDIWVRSAYTMLGYWNNPDATAETIDPEGWLSMGDIGALDDDGYLTINSRARDMILRSAENIYPIEIENRLAAHPAVTEVAVVGVDHPEHGQEVKAVVVTDDTSDTLAEDLRAWCAEALAPFKVPTVWQITAEPLPRNASGKVVKRDLGP